MSDLIAWIKQHVRKNHLKEFIMAHTGLTPPAFIAVVALAAAGTCLTVSAVSSLLAPPKNNDENLESILNEKIMPYSNNQRDVEVTSTLVEEPKEEEEEEEEAPVEDKPEAEAPAEDKLETEVPAEEVKDLAEEVEVATKEEETETTAPTVTTDEDNTMSDYVDINDTASD